MRLWVTADTHFGEQPKARQKASGLSAEALDNLLRERWLEYVAVDDVIWHLGDVGDWARLAELPGTKHLVYGNNDRRRREIAQSGVFATTSERTTIESAEGTLLLIHDPAHAVGHEGAVLHGHLHALPSPAPSFISVSVDRHNWSPVALDHLMTDDDRSGADD